MGSVSLILLFLGGLAFYNVPTLRGNQDYRIEA